MIISQVSNGTVPRRHKVSYSRPQTSHEWALKKIWGRTGFKLNLENLNEMYSKGKVNAMINKVTL